MGKVSRRYELRKAEEYWIDAHCHLCSEPLSDVWLQEVEKASAYNISLFISTALTRKETEWHFHNPHPLVKVAAGIHPYYDKSNINDIPYLQRLAEEGVIWGLGEIGFDKRKNNHNYQSNILLQQLDIANEYQLPVIFHIVGRYNELYQVLKNDYSDIRGYIHGFSGSVEMVSMLSRLNVGFSIGMKIIQRKDAAEVLEAIIENGFYLFETDAPFQRDTSVNAQEGFLSNLLTIVKEVSELTSISEDDLLDGQWESFQRLTNR